MIRPVNLATITLAPPPTPPTLARCEHYLCTADEVAPDVLPCTADLQWCCGCCLAVYDDHDGGL